MYASESAGFKTRLPHPAFVRSFRLYASSSSASIRFTFCRSQAGLSSHFVIIRSSSSLSLHHHHLLPSSPPSRLPLFQHGLDPFLFPPSPKIDTSMSLSLLHLVALVATLSHVFIGTVNAHGYVTAPASRAYFCKEGQAKNCGEIQYEPQSVEAPKGLPFTRNGDGKLCSAGLAQFSELDRQGAKVWPTNKASDVHSFSWTFTAQHATPTSSTSSPKPTGTLPPPVD